MHRDLSQPSTHPPFPLYTKDEENVRLCNDFKGVTSVQGYMRLDLPHSSTHPPFPRYTKDEENVRLCHDFKGSL